MRLYKAILNNEYKVISFEEPKDTETVFSRTNREEFDVDKNTIRDYIDIQGHILTYKTLEIKDGYTMFLDIDYRFNSLWDNQPIYVAGQINKKLREDLFKSVKEGDYDKIKELSCHYAGIIGEKELVVDETTYVYHQDEGGIWESSEPRVITVDKNTGVIKAENVGSSTITYKVKTNAGELTCFLKIRVK